MEIGFLLKRSGQIVWRRKFLWALGFLISLNGVLLNTGRLLFGTELPALGRELLAWQQRPDITAMPLDIDLTPQLIGQVTFWSIVLVFVIFIGFWLAATWAEAAVILAVKAVEADEPVGLVSALRQGYRWLGRFIAIDAIAFFPWFILALAILLLMILLTLLIGWQAVNQAEWRDLVLTMVLGALCLIPLTLLLAPVGWLTLMYRILAFRDAALLEHSARSAVRHTWQVIKRQFGLVVATLVMLWAVKTAVSWATELLFWPVVGAAALFNLPDPLTWLLNGLIFLLVTLIEAIFAAYLAVAWTLAYAAWAAEE